MQRERGRSVIMGIRWAAICGFYIIVSVKCGTSQEPYLLEVTDSSSDTESPLKGSFPLSLDFEALPFFKLVCESPPFAFWEACCPSGCETEPKRIEKKPGEVAREAGETGEDISVGYGIRVKPVVPSLSSRHTVDSPDIIPLSPR